MKIILPATALALAALPVIAAGPSAKPQARGELSAPIVMFTPLVKKHADTLQLTPDQRADLANWIATMPAKRQAIEAEARAARAKLRTAIVAGAPVAERQKLAETVGAYETKLVMARSACTDHWRQVLSPAQFAQLMEIAQAK